jgi:aldehyde:ferredoxin oxidoreductase
MNAGGFAGQVLHVDLTDRRIEKEPLDLDLAQRFIGGLGLTIKLAYDSIVPGTDPLSPKNPLVLGAGPLVGTNLPSTSRIYAVTKLPTSGTVGWCGSGGVNFGYLFKNAGYDHLIIRGRADRPVYLKIVDDKVEICDAAPLWGKGAEEASEALWAELGQPAGVMAIGQAGENLVPFSIAFIDRIATLGRGGLGALMGAKNLKAVVVKGGRGIKVADRKKYKGLAEDFLQTILSYPYLKEWQDLGLVKSFPMITRETYFRMKKRRIACVSCPIGCKDVIEIPDGDFKGLIRCTSSVINLYTPVLYGFKDYRESIKCMATLDDYGLDMFEFFGIMSFAKTLVDHGVIPPNQVDEALVTDSLPSMETWARKITYREGLGDTLARGFEGILEEFGKVAEEYAPPLVKGMQPYVGPGAALGWDLFGTMELGQVLDPRGPHVGASGSPTYFARRPLEVFPRHLARMGVPEEAFGRILPGLNSTDQQEELRVGRLLKYSHAWFSTLGSLGVCARAAINRFYNASLCAQFYEAVTGISMDLDSLRRRVDRLWTLFRMANIREGLNRKAEALPIKWFSRPGFKDYTTEKPLSLKEAEEMVEDYYEEWGWNRKTGIPSPQLLKKLGLKES